jgi:hypothetical protein
VLPFDGRPASASLHELAHVQGHLAAQDELLTSISAKLGMDPVPLIDNPPDDTFAAGDADGSDPGDEMTGQGQGS